MFTFYPLADNYFKKMLDNHDELWYHYRELRETVPITSFLQRGFEVMATSKQVSEKAKNMGVSQSRIAEHLAKPEAYVSRVLAWGDGDPLADIEGAIDAIVMERAQAVQLEQEAVAAA